MMRQVSGRWLRAALTAAHRPVTGSHGVARAGRCLALGGGGGWDLGFDAAARGGAHRALATKPTRTGFFNRPKPKKVAIEVRRARIVEARRRDEQRARIIARDGWGEMKMPRNPRFAQRVVDDGESGFTPHSLPDEATPGSFGGPDWGSAMNRLVLNVLYEADRPLDDDEAGCGLTRAARGRNHLSD